MKRTCSQKCFVQLGLPQIHGLGQSILEMPENSEGNSMMIIREVVEETGMLWLSLPSAICVHEMY